MGGYVWFDLLNIVCIVFSCAILEKKTFVFSSILDLRSKDWFNVDEYDWFVLIYVLYSISVSYMNSFIHKILH